MTVTVGIVEDHDLFRSVLHDVVDTVPDLSVSFEAVDVASAKSRLDEHRVALVLVDLSLPDASGIELVGEIRVRWPDVRCVVVSGHRSDAYAQRALDAGAQCYVLKGSTSELREAIAAALAGGTFVSPAVTAG